MCYLEVQLPLQKSYIFQNNIKKNATTQNSCPYLVPKKCLNPENLELSSVDLKKVWPHSLSVLTDSKPLGLN